MRVRDLSLRTPTLDDVFLSATGERIGDYAEGAGDDTTTDKIAGEER